jgi:uncharacterized protein (DUF2147 family)
MKKTIVATLFILSQLSVFAQREIIGKWLSQDKEATIEIYENQGKFFGKFVWLKKATDAKGQPLTDTENPNAALRKQPLMNLVMLTNMYFDNKKWKGGTIYNPDSGKSYKCEMWQKSPETLNVRGYLGLFYGTETWTRAK